MVEHHAESDAKAEGFWAMFSQLKEEQFGEMIKRANAKGFYNIALFIKSLSINW